MSIRGFLACIFIGVFIYGCSVTNIVPPPVQVSQTPITEDENDIYKSVVRLRLYTFDKSNGIVATGFAINKKHIVTVAHFCVHAAGGPLSAILSSEVEMTYLNNNRELATAEGIEIVAIGEKYDLCLLKKEKHGIIPLPVVKTYSKKFINIGDKVKVVGSPLDHFPVETTGKVVALSSKNSSKKFDKRLVVSADTAEGNSGSPVLNSKKEVLGVVIAVAERYSHITLAAPSWMLKRFLKESGK